MNKEIRRKKNRGKYAWEKNSNKSRFTNVELKAKRSCLNAIIKELIAAGYNEKDAIFLTKNSHFSQYYNELIRKQDIEGMMWLHHDFWAEEEARHIHDHYKRGKYGNYNKDDSN